MIKLDKYTISRILDIFPNCLNQREKQIIGMRYELNGSPKKTLQQIGDMFGVCRERIRQLEKRALRKLRHPTRLNNAGLTKGEL